MSDWKLSCPKTDGKSHRKSSGASSPHPNIVHVAVQLTGSHRVDDRIGRHGDGSWPGMSPKLGGESIAYP